MTYFKNQNLVLRLGVTQPPESLKPRVGGTYRNYRPNCKLSPRTFITTDSVIQE